MPAGKVSRVRKRFGDVADVLDRINRAQGRGAVHYAGEGLGERWRMRQRLKSAANTTEEREVPVIRCEVRGTYDQAQVSW